MRFIYFISLLGLVSCELPSDEEIRQDLVGTWERCDCSFPYDVESPSVKDESSLNGLKKLLFHSDGSYAEIGNSESMGYCKFDTCSSVLPNGYNDYCTCTWNVVHGDLIITSEGNSDYAWLNRPLPLKYISDDLLVFDNMSIHGPKQKKICYEKK